MLPAADLLVRLDRRRTVHHLWLDRLTQPEVAHFLASSTGRPLPSKTAGALYARTGGNPFFLEEILSAAGDADPECLATQPLPFTLAEIVRRQLDGLSGDERRVIDAASVLGRGASFDVLAAVTRMNEQELIGHLRGLVDRGLITEDRPDEFMFRHALVRDAVEDQLLGRERRRLHEAALAALRESGERRHRGACEARARRRSLRRVPRPRARGRYVLPRAGLVLSSVAPRDRRARRRPGLPHVARDRDARGVARRPRRRSPRSRAALAGACRSAR